MERKKNYCLIGIIILLIGICSIMIHQDWIKVRGLAHLLLGGAFFLLYYTKQKSWAIWWAIFFTGLWCSNILSDLFANSHSVGGIFLFLLPGAVLLRRFYTTGWDGFVIPGCFLVWGGCYVLLSNFERFAQRPCTSLVLCLVMVFYTARNIKRKKTTISVLILRSALFFAICSVLVGLLW